MPFAFDSWHTILQEVTVGTPGQTDARIQTWIAPEGQPYTLLLDETYDTRSWLTVQDTVFEAVWFTNLAWGAVVPDKPVTECWIDEVIISTDFIPAPGFDTTGSLRTADAIITFRVGDGPVETVAPGAPQGLRVD